MSDRHRLMPRFGAQLGKSHVRAAALIAAMALSAAGVPPAVAEDAAADAVPTADPVTFTMVRSTSAVAGHCLIGAGATVTITKLAQAERMTISAHDLPPNTGFDVFVIQNPNSPFGMSWYQGDLESNGAGNATVTFIGRFNIETFIVSPGGVPVARPHKSPPFPDATSNPTTAPVHTYHLGIWFNSPVEAAAAGCPNTVTPFNGDHKAGIQALSTRNITTGPVGPLHRVP
jgi:hypothetical protein